MSKVSIVSSLTSVIKGDHIYRSGVTVDVELECQLEPENIHSIGRNAIKVMRGSNVIGHVPESLAQKLAPLMRDGTIVRVVAKITGESRAAPEGMWTQGGGIEIPCKYKLHGLKTNKSLVRQTFTK